MAIDPTLAAVGALILATVFGAAGVTKLRSREAFAGVVANFRLLPDRLAGPVALLLPPAELILAAAVLLPATRAPAAACLGVLLVAFAAAMAVNLRRGRAAIDCGCAIGLLKERISWPLVARNLLLAAVAAGLALAEREVRPLAWLDWFTISAATGCGLLLYTTTGRLFGHVPVRLEGAS